MDPKVFAYPADQHFACRDCPSRCCKNWTVDITLADVSRFRGENWVEKRLKETGADFLALGPDHFLLPVVEVDHELRCVFLEQDGLCGLHRRFGHDFLATTCQTFPFDFLEGEKGEVITITSQVCPSIRDNYGVPLGEIIEKKFAESGGIARKQSPYLILGTSTRLNLRQYNAIFRKWEEIIGQEKCLPLALTLCFRAHARMVDDWNGKTEIPESEFSPGLEAAWDKAWASRRELMEELVRESRTYHRIAQVLLAFACLPLSQPFRSRITYRGKRKLAYTAGVLQSLFKLLLNRGKIDILYLGREIPLREEHWQSKVLDEKRWPEVRNYLLKVLRRRRFSMDPKNLSEILLLLAIITTGYGFFAKLHAANLGKNLPDSLDFKEAVSALEMSVLHQNVFFKGTVYETVLSLLLKSPDTITRLLTAEVPFSSLNNYSLDRPRDP